MWQDFNGSINWDELAEICGDSLRGWDFEVPARFRGYTVARNFGRVLNSAV